MSGPLDIECDCGAVPGSGCRCLAETSVFRDMAWVNTLLFHARRVLRAYDRADALPLLERARRVPDETSPRSRILVPLRGESTPPRHSVRVTVPAATREIDTDRMIIADPSGWIIEDLQFGSRPQLAPFAARPGRAGLPASLFAGGVVDQPALDRVRQGDVITMILTRRQDFPEAEPHCVLFGTTARGS